MKKLVLLFCVLPWTMAWSQTDPEKARELGIKAIAEMESGNMDVAIELLEEAKKLDPGNIDYPYEIAFAHYLNKDYPAAIKLLNKLKKHDQVNDLVYQMLGNCYDMNGEPDKAIQSYEQGLVLFPHSGKLYLERGNMELAKKEYNEALFYYEKGIEVNPEFPSNYYWATRIYLGSNEEVWGLLYGEIFMNLERNSKRTMEISRLLFKTYKSQITFASDTSMTVSFCQQMVMNISDLSDPEDLRLPFCMVYEPTLLLSLVNVDSIDLHSLNGIRSAFIENYYRMGHQNTYPNVLFDYQQKMLAKGHLEAYNYWILMQGDFDTFESWKAANMTKWDNFVSWFIENPIGISQNSRFYREQY